MRVVNRSRALIALRAPMLALLACGAMAMPPAALAQSHELTRHGFTVRSSTVVSSNLDPATARRHGIERSPTRGVLNVVVLREQGRSDASERTVRADVHARARNLAGIEREIPMREVRHNGYVSYVGGYGFEPREVLDFRIEAQPRDSREKLVLKYRERLWAGQ